MYDDKLLLTPTEAAAKLGCSTATIYNYIHSGLLKAFRAPGHRAMRIRYCDLVEFVETTWINTQERVQPLKRKCDFPRLFNIA